MKLRSNRFVITCLVQKLSDKERTFKSSLYADITVAHFLERLEMDEEDIYVIKINKLVYNSALHDYLFVDKYKIKQELIRKEFKEKIILQLDDVDDILRIAPDTKEFKSTYGYAIKTTVNITTK